jgi:hypothetical protein
MLRLHTGTSAYGVKNDFRQSDYYASESVGRWGGGLADDLGLHSRVTMADFDKMADNINPATGKRLTLRTNKFRRIGEDIIFSLPNDVGAFIMLRPPEERDALLAMVERRVYQVIWLREGRLQGHGGTSGREAYSVSPFSIAVCRRVANSPTGSVAIKTPIAS